MIGTSVNARIRQNQPETHPFQVSNSSELNCLSMSRDCNMLDSMIHSATAESAILIASSVILFSDHNASSTRHTASAPA